MNRRTALKAAVGVLAAPLASNAKPLELVIPIRADTTEFKALLQRAMDDQLGIPPNPQGVVGVTYFKAGGGHWPVKAKLFLNGCDVTAHATECDLVGGWAVLLDCDTEGKRIRPLRARVHRGVLEVR